VPVGRDDLLLKKLLADSAKTAQGYFLAERLAGFRLAVQCGQEPCYFRKLIAKRVALAVQTGFGNGNPQIATGGERLNEKAVDGLVRCKWSNNLVAAGIEPHGEQTLQIVEFAVHQRRAVAQVAVVPVVEPLVAKELADEMDGRLSVDVVKDGPIRDLGVETRYVEDGLAGGYAQSFPQNLLGEKAVKGILRLQYAKVLSSHFPRPDTVSRPSPQLRQPIRRRTINYGR